MVHRLRRHFLAPAVALIAFGALAALLYAIGLAQRRAILPGEAEVLFEADRIRQGFSLYTDPNVGASDYGSVPSRFYVLYPPLWSWLVAHAPQAHAACIARALGTAGWFVALALAARSAIPACRKQAAVAAAYVASIYVLALFATSGRPDAIALLLATIAMTRSVRRGAVGALAGALFALAVLVKPNVFGMAAGAFAASLLVERQRIRGLVAFAVTLASAGALLDAVSGGAWLRHVVWSLVHPTSPSAALLQVIDRAPFFLLPLGLALACGWRARGDPKARIALFALVASFGVTVVTLANAGSASNYWLETSVAGVLVLGQAPLPAAPRSARAAFAVGSLLALQAAYTTTATVTSVSETYARARVVESAIRSARERCGVSHGGVILSDEPGLEWMANGRVIGSVFTLNEAVRAGRLPLSTWAADYAREDVTCVLATQPALGMYAEPIREIIASRFAPVQMEGGWVLYGLGGETTVAHR